MTRTRKLLPAMARTSQTLTQNQIPWAMRKDDHKRPTRLMSQKNSQFLRDPMETTLYIELRVQVS
jgi:hypothetical protein